MKEPYGEDKASHPGPESCVGAGNGAGEALTGENTGRAIELRNQESGVPTLLHTREGNTASYERRDGWQAPRSRRTRACVDTSCAGIGRARRRPMRIVSPGRPRKVTNDTLGVHVAWQSNGGIVPEKQPNKGGPDLPLAEAVEGRLPTKGTAPQPVAYRILGRENADEAVARAESRCFHAIHRGKNRMR